MIHETYYSDRSVLSRKRFMLTLMLLMFDNDVGTVDLDVANVDVANVDGYGYAKFRC